MQTNQATRGGCPDVTSKMALCSMLGSPSDQEVVMSEIKSKLAWEKRYSKMLEELIGHYQLEINYLKAQS
jgi:hypothetical protein